MDILASTPQAESPTDPIDRDRLLVERDLMSLQKPAQYLGGELNAVTKNESEVEVRMALAFPDTYEVGMSHTGIQILYHIVNGIDYAWAERSYMPLPDMERLLRIKGAKLCSLEARRPLNKFDIVGFSLQYELCVTNVLAMLELGGIPIYATDRTDGDPLIIGGGPYCYHPEVIAPFFDAFFLGDAEEGIVDLVETIRSMRKSGITDRSAILEAVSKIEGIYLPSRFDFDYESGDLPSAATDEVPNDPNPSAMRWTKNGRISKITPADPDKSLVTRRLLVNLDGSPFPNRPVVPNIKTVHNRLNVEVMRGCVRGCRFCQAGYLYRPQRERSPEEILRIIDEALPTTGFEEVSLLSLSTADYCSIVPLLKAVMGRYGDEEKVAVSFPSTRVDALTEEVLSQVQRVRRTSFTLAPEAGTQRLRDVINKGVTDEQIVETCRVIFKMGWSGVKLYFMMGLPTETEEDLQGIIDTAARVRAIPEARGKMITIAVSTFVPKPHTPFQWSEQITPAETIRRQRFLAEGLRLVKVNFRYHQSFSTFLEGVFCRGDRRLAAVIARAYELGCRLDAWDEHLSEEKWMQAFHDCNIDPNWFLRARDLTEVLPWDHLSCGIPKSYFAKEYSRSLRDKTTPDCLLTSCSICGACDYDSKRNVLWPRAESDKWLATLGLESETRSSGEVTAPLENIPLDCAVSDRGDAKVLLATAGTGKPGTPPLPTAGIDPTSRIRIRYRKNGAVRYFGHLEIMQMFHRGARRSGLPVAYTLGFHPMPKFAFGPPLQLGVGSTEEYVDLYMTSPLNAETTMRFFNQTLPGDLQIAEAWEVPLRAPSLQESLTSYRYRIDWISEPKNLLGDFIRGEFAADGAIESILNTVIDRNIASDRNSEQRNEHPEPSSAKFSDTDSPETIVKDRSFGSRGKGRSGARDRKGNGKNREKVFLLGDYLSQIELTPESLEFTVSITPGRAAPRLTEILTALSGLEIGDYNVAKIGSEFRPGFDCRPAVSDPEMTPAAAISEAISYDCVQ